MINREKRKRAKDLIERFLHCEIGNTDFSSAFPADQHDRALGAIRSNLWPYYCDTHTHKREGTHGLNREATELFLRCALFLDSGLEYEWPPHRWIGFRYGFMRLLGFGRRVDEGFEVFKSHGDFEVWPFIRREDYAKFGSGR
jgi:hypothetical protein